MTADKKPRAHRIIVSHPAHEDFISDPTHVGALAAQFFSAFSRVLEISAKKLVCLKTFRDERLFV
jgi:hypothetical protein